MGGPGARICSKQHTIDSCQLPCARPLLTWWAYSESLMICHAVRHHGMLLYIKYDAPNSACAKAELHKGWAAQGGAEQGLGCTKTGLHKAWDAQKLHGQRLHCTWIEVQRISGFVHKGKWRRRRIFKAEQIGGGTDGFCFKDSKSVAVLTDLCKGEKISGSADGFFEGEQISSSADGFFQRRTNQWRH